MADLNERSYTDELVDLLTSLNVDDMEHSALEQDNQPSKHAHIEEVEDEEPGGLLKDPFVHLHPTAGRILRKGKTIYDKIHETQVKDELGDKLWEPFADDEEWDLVQFLIGSSLSQKDIDQYLKLKIMSSVSLTCSKAHNIVSRLGIGPSWLCETFESKSDELDEEGNQCIEYLELWRCNPLECIRELIRNPIFCEYLRYAPEEVFEDVYGEKSIYTRATILIGYLPVTKLENFSKENRALRGYQLFHNCMRLLLKLLVAAGMNGITMNCTDGFQRKIYLIVAAYVADHPEQCLIACCQENRCPKCLVDLDKRAVEGDITVSFITGGLQAVRPFWTDLPHCDIFSCITPDILHQLHKGVFKDHTVKWATASVNEKGTEVDCRFQAMTAHPDLRYFHKGISLISQWTGTKYKNTEKVFLRVIAGAAEKDVILAVRAVLDFIYYAHFETHTEESLQNLDRAWQAFHRYKHVFLRNEVRKQPAFNIPKLHLMIHYVHSIRLLGTADGYSTEGPERLHIDFAKLGYCASNRKQYISQMATWLNCQEAVRHFEGYLQWLEVRKGADGSAEDKGESDGEEDSVAETKVAEDDEESVPSLERYKIAKKPPYLCVPIKKVITQYGAPDFIECLQDFLRGECEDACASTATQIHGATNISIFKQFKVTLLVMSQVSKKATVNTVRAIASQLTKKEPFEAESPGSFFTVLTHTSRQTLNQRNEEHLLHDLAVAEVRAIFQLAGEHSCQYSKPLAYVQWFTSFQARNNTVGMYTVSHSTHNHRHRASVIPITDIEWTCHLIPVWGVHTDYTVTRHNALERYTKFYVNLYLRHYDFVIFRLLLDRWLRKQNERAAVIQPE
ncbi:hypothetical protein NM688_g777 [Phlebia brevispora]|uniref:Uncharacterized protein n=1 Tax=Phlebia brevispora TaxID=194682 RepID=A0ACC1TD14_9APHY|nr:hypothetical protein NM688_g777 [Phlebia brevispora]